MAIRVMVVDDHAMVRTAVSALINQAPDMQVIGETVSGHTAIMLAQAYTPDVVLIDMDLVDMTGMQLSMALIKANPQIRILGWSVSPDPSYGREFWRHGAAGYVWKRDAADTIIEAIRTIASGGWGFTSAMTDPALGTTIDRARLINRSTDHLSRREATVLRLLAKGYSHKEVASQLQLLVQAIETIKLRAMTKLGLQSRIDIIQYAGRQGWR